MLSIGKKLTPEEAKEYNRDLFNYRSNGGGGCIGALPCENCYYLISDSLCLCGGVFTCPNCGFENGTKFSFVGNIPTFSWTGPVFDYKINTGTMFGTGEGI